MIASKIIKTYDGTILFVDHIVSVAKTEGGAMVATMVDGSRTVISLQGRDQLTTILGNHVHLIGHWTA